MKSLIPFSAPMPLLLLLLGSSLLAGCFMKQKTMATRSFLLSTMVSEVSASTKTNRHLAIGIGQIKMPPYLQKNSLSIRKSDNEIEYLVNSLWAEDLSDSFQRAVAANLGMLVPTDRTYLSSWRREDVSLCLFVTIEQFDVDTSGIGRLSAWWRITNPDANRILHSGHSRFSLSGPPPTGNPQAEVKLLSSVVAEFSRILAQAVSDSLPAEPSGN